MIEYPLTVLDETKSGQVLSCRLFQPHNIVRKLSSRLVFSVVPSVIIAFVAYVRHIATRTTIVSD